MPKSSKTPTQPSAAQRRKAAKPAAPKEEGKAPAKPRASRAKAGNGAARTGRPAAKAGNGAARADGASAKGSGGAAKRPGAAATGTATAAPEKVDFGHKPVDIAAPHAPAAVSADVTDFERGLLGDLLAVIEEHSADAALEIDRDAVERAFVFACEHHADQLRRSGEDFIIHPVGVAKICAGMRLDTETLCAALLHDTVEDTSASLDEVREEFGEEIATLVDGVTKLTGITFQSRDERQAENYRKMIVAMSADVRVILIKLADRLHNMRTLGPMPKQKQQEKAKETLEIFAPLAHQLGIHAIK